MAREFTETAINLVDNGMLDWETLARVALNWMSEDDVQKMCQNSHELEELFEEESDDDDDDE